MVRAGLWACLLCLICCLEAAAQSEMREWSDKSGKFKMQGKFVALVDGKVTLTKPDGKKLEIALDKLSDNDRKYVEGMNDNPFEAGAASPSDNPFESGAQLPPRGKKKGDAWMAPDFAKLRKVAGLTKKDKNVWQMEPVPREADLAASVDIPKFSFHERVSGSAMSPNGHWMALSVNDPFAGSRIHLMSLKDGQLVASVEIPKPEDHKAIRPQLLAVSPDGKYIVTGSDHNAWDRAGAMRTKLWTVVGAELKPSLEWAPFDTGSTEWHQQDKSRVTWGAFTDPKRLLLQADGYVVSWDITTGKTQYQAGLNADMIKFTPDGQYALAASRTTVGVMDVTAGKILFYRDINASGSVDLSPDGTRMLVHGGENIEILDVATGVSKKQIKVEQQGQSFWAGNHHILVGEHALLDVEEEFVSWNYTGQKATFTAGGKIWFLGTDDEKAVLRAESLPHAAALSKIDEAKRDPAFFLLQPGSAVNVDVQVPADGEAIKATLIAKINGAGFKYDPAAALTFVATKTTGQSEEISVRDFGSFGTGEKFTFTPQIVSLDLMETGKSVWQRARRGYVPGIFDIRQGETKQTALLRYQDPGMSLFENVTFPKFIVRPGKAGETKITTEPLD